MGVEVMIYIYGAVCLSMIVFNTAYNLAMRSSEPRLEKQEAKLRARVTEELAAVRRGEPVSAAHMDYLARALSRVNNLLAFDRVLTPLFANQVSSTNRSYLDQLQPMVLRLAMAYRERENTQAACFTYFLSHYTQRRDMPIDSLQDILVDYVRKDSLYCRVNALDALYTFGSADHVVQAVVLQDDGKVFVHDKLLTEGLLTFHGDHRELIGKLLSVLDRLSPRTQLAVLNYIRFCTAGYEREMFAIMQDESRDKELRLSAIRYFGRYEYAPALEPLLAFASDKSLDKWEYTTVSVSSLARYPGDRVIEVLKGALHSSNWYVRSAAAQSLEARGVGYGDLLDVVSSGDRYAREMILYRLESHRLKEGEPES
ncbi:MAG: HEAT repeat domain-containing protein [Acutalibacter sp.]